MNKEELANRVARELHCSLAEAADDVDKLVHCLLRDLKRLPGIFRKEHVKVAGSSSPKAHRE